MKKLIAIVLALSVFLGFAFWKFLPLLQKPQTTGPVTLTFWGLWDDDKQLSDVIAAYEKENPNVRISYVHQSQVNYRTRVQTQIQAGQGPDIFMIHNSWTPTFLKFNSLSPAPDSVITPDEFSKTFYPVAKDSFVVNNQVYALPLSIDGLALYYNTDLMTAQGLTPPTDWFSFVNDAGNLTVRDNTGVIKTAGAGLGSSNNIDYWPDIIGLLYAQQPGADLNDLANPYGVQVLKFYSSFVTDPKHKAWDQTLQNSTVMFEQGNLAFYFAPSSQISVIKAANPNLHFKVTPVPQLPGNAPAAWASFWAPAVSFSSPHQQEAWQFLKFLTSSDAEQVIFQESMKLKGYGEPYSRKDLAPQLAQDPLYGAFVTQGPYYKGGYLSSGTQDAGLDDEAIKLFDSGVSSVLQGGDPGVALQTAQSGVQKLMDTYTRVAVPSPR